MTQVYFQLLIQKIICSVGERAFKLESYIDAFRKDTDKMYMAHEVTSGGYISEEVKLDITLRLLAEVNTMDLAAIFNIGSSVCTKILYEAILEWAIDINRGYIHMK